ncbi:MAG: tetratricopeptide repeat protein [Limnospira sp.]
MNAIANVINSLTRTVFKVAIIDFYKKVSATKKEFKNAQKLAQKKHIMKATKVANLTLSKWSNHPSFVEQKLRQLLMGDLLIDLKSRVNLWKRQIKSVKKMMASAQALEKSDPGDPMDTTTLSKALAIYQKCQEIMDVAVVKQATARCQNKIIKYNQFRTLFGDGQKYAQQKQYKKAKLSFERAQILFQIPILQEAIANCSGQIQGQIQYETKLQQAFDLATKGEFNAALNVVNSALKKFPRQDGQKLVAELNRVIQGKDCYRRGLSAEQSQNFPEAESCYKRSHQLLPELAESKIRLAVLSIKTQNWQQAIAYLQGHSGEKISYLRGFAHLGLGELKQAEREWRSLSHPQINSQLKIVRQLMRLVRLKLMRQIEQFVDAQNLESARATSTQFLQTYGSDSLVEGNLNNHIQPRLEAQIWDIQDWQKIAQETEKIWLQNGDAKSLHNWAIATYYQAQIDPQSRPDWIVAATTALANVKRDPALKNIPWLPQSSIDFYEVFDHFLGNLETAIDSLKDENLAEYMKLRDRLRLDAIALKFIKKSPHQAAKINDMILLPGCYHRHNHHFANVRVSQASNSTSTEANILPALYTSWGSAVAAAFDGDMERAIYLKPSRSYQFNPHQKNEYFAQKFVAYSEGCHHLQKRQWRQSVGPLNAIKNELRSHPEWHRELDRLCQSQRQALNSLPDHLAFSDFWYQLLATEASCSYWVESRIQEIGENLEHQKIDKIRALSQLRELQKTDGKNPRLIYVIEALEFEIEVNEIIALMQSNLNDAVRRAKRCNNERVKRHIAALLIEILITGVNQNQMNGETAIQFARWAHQICPNDPEFVEIYRQCGIY